jgi:hypothetical protein
MSLYKKRRERQTCVVTNLFFNKIINDITSFVHDYVNAAASQSHHRRWMWL